MARDHEKIPAVPAAGSENNSNILMWLKEVSVCIVYVNYLLPSLLAAYNAILRWQVQHMIKENFSVFSTI